MEGLRGTGESRIIWPYNRESIEKEHGNEMETQQGLGLISLHGTL